MSFKAYISKSTLFSLIISTFIVFGTSGCKNATNNTGTVSDSQFNAPGADSTSAPNLAEAEIFVYDDKWRDKVTDTDTELCLKDIISSGFDFQTIFNTPDNEKDGLASKYIVDLMTIDMKETDLKNLQTLLALDILNSENELYKLSKGKYRCNFNKISEYEIKEFSGFDKRFILVFKNFILLHQKNTFKRYSTEDTNHIIKSAYFFMIAKAYQKFIKNSGYDITFSYPIIDKPFKDNHKEAPDVNAASAQPIADSYPNQFPGGVLAVHPNHRERQQIMPVFNAEECKFYKNAKLTPDAKTAPKNLSRFLKSFNPSFYEYAIQRFIDNPITVTRTAKTCTMPLDGDCYLYEQFFLDSNCSINISDKNAFITVSDAQKYQLNKGDVFPTCLLDSKKTNKSGTECRGKFKNNSYWQVLEDTPHTIYQWSQGTDSEECNEVTDKVIFVYDQEGIETRRALYNEIELGMQNLNQLCN